MEHVSCVYSYSCLRPIQISSPDVSSLHPIQISSPDVSSLRPIQVSSPDVSYCDAVCRRCAEQCKQKTLACSAWIESEVMLW
jgi:hypothetical protein